MSEPEHEPRPESWERAERTPILPVRTKVLHASGSAAFGAQLQIGGLMLFFYNQVLGVPAAWVSLALAIVVLVDAFWDPMIGQFSDRLRSRWGRRHPLMYAAALPTAVCFVFLWNPPSGWSDPALFAYLLVFIFATRLAASFYGVPSAALTPELAPDYHDRTILVSFRWVGGTIGAAFTAILAYGVFLRSTPDYPMGQLNPAGYAPLSYAIGALIFVSILVSTLGTHHRIPTLHRPSPKAGSWRETFAQIVATLRNRNFGVAVIAGMLGGVGGALTGGLSIYFGTFFWELPSRNLLVVVLSGLAATPVASVVAPLVSRRWGKRNACMTLFFISVVFAAGPFVLRLNDLFVPNGSPLLVPLLTAFAFLTGVVGTGGFILVTSMLADIVEEAQVNTGRRSEGLLMSADSFLHELMEAMGTVLPGTLLAVVGFPEEARPDEVAQTTLNSLVWYYVVLTVVLNTLSIAVWWFYRIDRRTHEKHLDRIRRAAVEASGSAAADGQPADGPRSDVARDPGS